MDPPDAELVRLARAGDEAGFGVLLRRHEARMLAVAYSVLGHGPDAQDAVQEAFLVAVSRLSALRDPEAVGAWLRGIVRNVSLATRRGREPLPIDDVGEQAVATAADPAEVLERQELKDWVWHALEGLTPNLRAVATLRLAHPDAAARARRSRREAEESLAAMTAGAIAAPFAEAWSPAAEVALPDGSFSHGYGRLAQGITVNNQEGVRVRLTNVVAGSDITVWETDFLNPADKPFHCPPAGVWLYRWDAGRIDRFRLLHAARP
jgi:RNA polymerase sigma-70 factor, ECF subfamily